MNLFTLVAKLGLDSSEYEEGLDKSEEKASSFGDKLKNGIAGGAKLGAAAIGSMAVAAGSAAAAIGKSALDSYSNYEQLAGGVKKLYGDASDEMMRYANQAYLTSGKSANEYMQTATSFSASLIKSLGGDTAKAAELTDVAMKAISDNVNTFGSDASAVEGAIQGLSRQNYTMLDNLKLGYAGSAQGMLELINDSGVLGKTLKDTSELANVGFDQMILAIEEVQKQQGIAGATSKEAMTTIEGSATATKAAWENVITAIGSGEGIAEASGGLITALFGENEGEGLVNQVLPRVEAIMQGISTFLVEASPMLLSSLEKIIGTVADTLPGTVMTIIPVIYEAVSSIISTLFNYIMSNLPTMMSAGVSLLQGIVSGISSNLPTMLQTGISMLSQFLATIMDYMPQLIVAGGQLIVSLVSGLIQSIPSLLDGIGNILSSMWNAFVDYDWLSLGKSIIDGIAQGISNFGSIIGNKLREIAGNAFDGVKKFFGIASPSKLMRDQIGRFIPEGIAVGIEANADSVSDAMKDLSNMTTLAFGSPEFSVESTSGSSSSNLLLNEIKGLKDSILGMQVVLDTGATVGGISNEMDYQLGLNATRRERGI